jgi:hypothetical protein
MEYLALYILLIAGLNFVSSSIITGPNNAFHCDCIESVDYVGTDLFGTAGTNLQDCCLVCSRSRGCLAITLE